MKTLTELNRITQAELNNIFRLHRLWMDTEGKKGERANLTGIDLMWTHFFIRDRWMTYLYSREGYLIGLDLKRVILRNAAKWEDLEAGWGSAKFLDADLRGVDLTEANLSHLTKQEFLDSVVIDENTILTDVKFEGYCKKEQEDKQSIKEEQKKPTIKLGKGLEDDKNSKGFLYPYNHLCFTASELATMMRVQNKIFPVIDTSFTNIREDGTYDLMLKLDDKFKLGKIEIKYKEE